MSDARNLHKLAQAIHPKLYVDAWVRVKSTVHGTAYTYHVEVSGMGLRNAVSAESHTEGGAIIGLKRAIASIRRGEAIDVLMKELQGPWYDHEREEWVKRLQGAPDRIAYDKLAADLKEMDQHRLDSEMGRHSDHYNQDHTHDELAA